MSLRCSSRVPSRPKAWISDFGSSVEQSENWRRERSKCFSIIIKLHPTLPSHDLANAAGRTGTLDWVPPESLKLDPRTGRLYEVTQKGDMWGLGLVLHCLCFFRWVTLLRMFRELCICVVCRTSFATVYVASMAQST